MYESAGERKVKWSFTLKVWLLARVRSFYKFQFHPRSFFISKYTHQKRLFCDSLVVRFDINDTVTMTSKFTEILDPEFQSTSPHCDVRLEDIIAASDLSNRGRTSSETSSASESSPSRSSRFNSGDRIDQKRSGRLSRIFSVTKRWRPNYSILYKRIEHIFTMAKMTCHVTSNQQNLHFDEIDLNDYDDDSASFSTL